MIQIKYIFAIVLALSFKGCFNYFRRHTPRETEIEMGCDIHAVFQAKRGGAWVDVPSSFEENRHYMLFAWLANVRNGYGFAGVLTHDPLLPISDPRGLPSDFEVGGEYGEDHPTTEEVIAMSWRSDWREPNEAAYIWMGDHSHSWLTADEILDSKVPRVLRAGVIPIEAFMEWDGESEPSEWCGSTSGPSVVVSNPGEITPKTTHVQIHWDSSPDEFDYFIDELKRLKNEYGEVRMVFGFDS